MPHFKFLQILFAILVFFVIGCTNEKDPIIPVEFTNVKAVGIQSTSATIEFTTTLDVRCKIYFGTSLETMNQTATNPDMSDAGFFSKTHSVPLEDLSPNTLYYYQAVTVDKEGYQSNSKVYEFSTLASSNDETLINVALAEQGATVSEVSSNYGGGGLSSDWGGMNAVDGSTSTEWATNGDGDGAFLTLDLGTSREIVSVGFRSRKMMDGTSIITSFKLIFDGSTELGPFETPDPDEFYRFDFDTAQSASHVKFQAVTSTGGNTGAKEIQLFIK